MTVDILLALTSVTIFVLMLTIGVNHSADTLLSLLRQPTEMARALVAVLVVVPIFVAVLLLIFDLPSGTASGMALLAAAPGAPLTTKRAQAAGAEIAYVAGMQVTLAVLAVLATPLILSFFYMLFELDIERASPGEVARQIATVTLLPVLVGLGLKRVAPDFVGKISKPLNALADALFLILMVVLVIALLVAPDLRAKLLIGWPAIVAILLFAAFALATGHLIGGPGRDRKGGLAIACLARNIGLAFFIAGASKMTNDVLPTLLAYLLLGAVLGILYSIWNKRSGRA